MKFKNVLNLRLLWIFLIVAISLFTFNNPYFINIKESFKPPSLNYLGGTDRLGRCLLSRSALGLRYSLYHAGIAEVLSVVISFTIALFVVILSKKTKILGNLIKEFLQGLRIVPPFLFALSIAVILRGTEWGLILSLTILSIIYEEYVFESELMDIIRMPQLESAISLGASRFWIFRKYIIPAILPRIIKYSILDFAALIAYESLFGFVGLSYPPKPSLGALIYESRPYIKDYPWLFLVPSAFLAIVLTGGWIKRFKYHFSRVLKPRFTE